MCSALGPKATVHTSRPASLCRTTYAYHLLLLLSGSELGVYLEHTLLPIIYQSCYYRTRPRYVNATTSLLDIRGNGFFSACPILNEVLQAYGSGDSKAVGKS